MKLVFIIFLAGALVGCDDRPAGTPGAEPRGTIGTDVVHPTDNPPDPTPPPSTPLPE